MAINIPFSTSTTLVKKLIMPRVTIRGSASLYMKQAPATLITSDLAGFWTALGLSHTFLGYESNVKSAAADTTEQTIIDVTDTGVLTGVVCPELSGAGTMTIRVTIDGLVTTFISETLAAGDRFCIGAFIGHRTQSNANNNTGLGGSSDGGFSVTTIQTLHALITPIQAMELAVVGMKFNTACKVTFQGSVNITGTAELLKAGTCYSLFIPEGV